MHQARLETCRQLKPTSQKACSVRTCVEAALSVEASTFLQPRKLLRDICPPRVERELVRLLWLEPEGEVRASPDLGDGQAGEREEGGGDG